MLNSIFIIDNILGCLSLIYFLTNYVSMNKTYDNPIIINTSISLFNLLANRLENNRDDQLDESAFHVSNSATDS